MTPPISERISRLEVLRRLTRKATAEFYQKPGMTDRFRVKASGFNCFEVVERTTGKVVTPTPCFGYGNAYRQRQELDALRSALMQATADLDALRSGLSSSGAASEPPPPHY